MTRRMRTAILWWLGPKFTVGVVGLVLDEEGRVLLLRHTYRPGREWGLPGGGLHLHESLEDCLRREIREETGMRVRVDRLLSAAAHFDRRLVDMIYACRPSPGESLEGFTPNPEVAEARFFPPDELPENMSRSQRRLVAVALRQANDSRKSKGESRK